MVTRPEGEQVYSLTSVERIYRDMIETMSESALNVTRTVRYYTATSASRG